MDGHLLDIIRDRISVVDRLTKHVEHAAKDHVAYRHSDRISCRCDFHAAAHAFRSREHDALYGVVADVLRYLHYEGPAVKFYRQGVVDPRHLAFIKFYVYYRSRDLHYTSGHSSSSISS